MARPALLVVALGAGVASVLAGCSGDNGTEGGGADRASTVLTDAAGDLVLGELPVARTEVAGATWKGALVVAGGLTADGGASDLVHTYDARAGRWVAAPSLPVPLHHVGMAVLGGRLFVAGGYTNGPGEAWEPQAAVRSLGPEDDRWRVEAPLPGGPRGALGLAATLTSLVAAGGEVGGQALARTEIFDGGSQAWRPGPDLRRPREHLALAAEGDRVYAVAGRTASDGNFTVVESLDPILETFWRMEPDLVDARGGIGAAVVDGRLCVAGGEEAAGTIDSVECLGRFRWDKVARLARPRHGLAVMALDGRLHVVGGGEQPGLFVSAAHEALDV